MDGHYIMNLYAIDLSKQTLLPDIVLLMDTIRSSHKNAFRWVAWDLTGDKSMLAEVITWTNVDWDHLCMSSPGHNESN